MPASDSDNLGTLLRRFRYSAGLSQEELAERSGISVRNISDLERGLRTAPRPETLRLLAGALELTPDQRRSFLETARPELAAGFPADRAPGATVPRPAWTSSLPVPLTPLIGRERVLDELSTLLAGRGARFTTLTGPGGTGKTRLAIEAARRAIPANADGVAFVGLASVSDPALVAASIAEVLGVPVSGGSLPKRLTTALTPRQLLLVLDNFEHVLDAAPLIAELLEAAPRLSILVTSRARLRLSSEHVFPVPGLDVPAEAESNAQLETSESLRLFVERAQAIVPNFNASEADRQAIADICRRLHGLPLAIELAASKVNVLPVSQIANRLVRLLPLLTAGSRDLPPRQRSMRDTIAWSYDLLAPQEQTLLRWLSPFVGGFSLEAAETTGSAAGLSPPHMLDLISMLVDSGLVVPFHGADGSPRFRMLETIREYGLEQLAHTGELAAARRTHAHVFLAFASDGAPTPSEHQDLTWVHRLATERDNLVSAFDHLCQPETAENCLRFAAAMGPFWDIHGPFEEGWERMKRAASLAPPDPTPLKVRVCYWAALLAGWCGDYDAGVTLAGQGITVAETIADETALAESLHIRGWLEGMECHWDEAAELLERELELWRMLENPFAQGRSLTYRALAHFGQGDLPLVQVRAEEALQLFLALGYPEWIAISHWYLGMVGVAEGRFADAAASYEQSLRNWLVDDIPSGEFKPMVGLADVAAVVGLHKHAARLLGAADAILQATDNDLFLFDRPGYERAEAASMAALGVPLFTQRYEEGRRLGPEQLLAVAAAIVSAISVPA